MKNITGGYLIWMVTNSNRNVESNTSSDCDFDNLFLITILHVKVWYITKKILPAHRKESPNNVIKSNISY